MESLLGHFNSFWVSVELGARPLHNTKFLCGTFSVPKSCLWGSAKKNLFFTLFLPTFDLLSGFPENPTFDLLFPYFNFSGFWGLVAGSSLHNLWGSGRPRMSLTIKTNLGVLKVVGHHRCRKKKLPAYVSPCEAALSPSSPHFSSLGEAAEPCGVNP